MVRATGAGVGGESGPGGGVRPGAGRRRVVVGVSGSPGSLAALHRAAYEARRGGADLLAVLAWEPPGGTYGYRRAVCPLPLEDLRQDAGRRLLDALGSAFGPEGPEVSFQAVVVQGATGPALVESAAGEDDLLVVGAGGRGPLRRALFPSVARYCLAHADCPVLAVPPSPLVGDLAAVRRRIGLHLPLDARELTVGSR
ncbi:universal stress protein [Streptomyces sp. NPDC006173]|uniref:universal stress protein n=1 Tax=Streptomyces sp. NPDC006173 TaxID=3155349 RepID=UPI00340DCDCF